LGVKRRHDRSEVSRRFDPPALRLKVLSAPRRPPCLVRPCLEGDEFPTPRGCRSRSFSWRSNRSRSRCRCIAKDEVSCRDRAGPFASKAPGAASIGASRVIACLLSAARFARAGRPSRCGLSGRGNIRLQREVAAPTCRPPLEASFFFGAATGGHGGEVTARLRVKALWGAGRLAASPANRSGTRSRARNRIGIFHRMRSLQGPR